MRAFQIQQELFGLQPAAEANHLAACPDNPVTGNNDGNGIGVVGQTDGTACAGRAQCVGDIAIGSGFTERNIQQRLPDPA